MYTNYEYYISEYLLGRTPAVPEKEFPYWEKQARAAVDQWTFNRVKKDNSLISEPVKDCVCAIAEQLYKTDKIKQNGDAPGLLTSYSNDGESATYDVSQSIYTEEGSKKKVRNLIYQYLGDTGLLYTGVD